MSAQLHNSVSAVTLVRGREAHLQNVILGLTRQTRRPNELIIGVMQERLETRLPDAPFPIRTVQIGGEALPLAQARNTVARVARGDQIVFLDVDCIPHASCLADYARLCTPKAGLLMGEVMYLPAGAAETGWSYDGFDRVAERHSDRQGPPEVDLKRCEDYRCFWSLNFAMHRDAWNKAGGFDERFTGYGGEDTDFGRTLDAQYIPIQWMRGGKVYHQYHPHCMPPIHHIPSILRNTEIFARKWGHRTMEHWIACFRMMGLVEQRPDGSLIQVRAPSEEDFALCRQQKHMPYANTTQVMRELRAMTDVAAE